MPIYEFYCKKCNTVYKFFSRAINTEKTPRCPICKDVTLKRQVSLFATVSGKKEGTSEDMPPIDATKMEKAMTMLASEAGKIDENDPRQTAMLMRKLSDTTGLRMGSGMEEALSRLERGEDPEEVEKEMGDIFESEEPFIFDNKRKKSSKRLEPRIDETLYEL